MALTKQAKILTKNQQETVLLYLNQTKHPERNTLIFLLSTRAGLRAKEISFLTCSMVTDAQGHVTNEIRLQNSATKGNCSGGVIPMNKDLKSALIKYQQIQQSGQGSDRLIISSRGHSMSPQQIKNMFSKWYKTLGFEGCSSHSGRRTFITHAARKIASVGGSMLDVKMLARHSSLQMTQRYVEFDVDAQRKVVQLL